MIEGASRRALLWAGLALALLPACREAPRTGQPQDFTRSTTCALDGMVLADYPGPKGQIQYDAGPPDFYCDTVEMLATLLRPEQHKRITAVYTQDMAKADWTEPRGHWIDARTAFYVRGSKLRGSMGPTLASFGSEADAQAFVGKNGGQVLRFDQVTIDMVSLDGGVIRDEHASGDKR